MGYIEGEDRNQIILFPESIDEQVSGNNSIRIIDEYIKQLDLEILGFKRAVNPLLGRKMERSLAMNTEIILLTRNVNLKPDVPAPKKAGASAGMLIRTSLTRLIHKPKGT